MPAPNLVNFGKATVSTGYNNSATSIVLSTGHGARFPASGSFWLTWWNATDYADPADDPNVEIVLCTARSSDTLTVTRGQDGTSASTKNTGGKTYKMTLPSNAAVFALLMPNELTTRGDMTTRGASAPQRLPVGSRAAALMSDGTDPRWIGPQNAVWMWEDWMGDAVAGTTSWTGANAGSGATPTVRAGDADRPGRASMETSASATGASAIRKQVSAGLLKLGSGLIEVAFGFRYVTALSDGSETYQVRIGISDNSTAQPANGVYIETSGTGVISGVGRKASTDTAASGGVGTVTGVNNTWYDCRIVIDATANSAEFFVDGVSLGTVASANLPTTAAMGLFAHTIKSAGTTDRRVEIDYFSFYKELTNARS